LIGSSGPTIASWTLKNSAGWARIEREFETNGRPVDRFVCGSSRFPQLRQRHLGQVERRIPGATRSPATPDMDLAVFEKSLRVAIAIGDFHELHDFPPRLPVTPGLSRPSVEWEFEGSSKNMQSIF
jgi:hypothetical protein